MTEIIPGRAGRAVPRITFGTWRLSGESVDGTVLARLDEIMRNAGPVAGPAPETMERDH